MPKKTVRRESGTPLTRFLRRPAAQLGLLGLAVLVIVLILVFNGGSGGLSATVSVDEAYQLYQQNGAFFLDVREPSEWDEYHAPNSTLIPLGELETRLTEVPTDRPIVVVCRSGNRSQQGRDILKQAGYTNVTSMEGGLKTWRDKGYPIVP